MSHQKFNYLVFALLVSNTTAQHLPQQQGQILSRGVSVSPQVLEPELIISGGPSIKQYHILNDKRHILTKDTDSHVALYDVLKAQRVEDLGQVDFEQESKNRGQVYSMILNSLTRLTSIMMIMNLKITFYYPQILLL